MTFALAPAAAQRLLVLNRVSVKFPSSFLVPVQLTANAGSNKKYPAMRSDEARKPLRIRQRQIPSKLWIRQEIA
jgi:hypothetical protein